MASGCVFFGLFLFLFFVVGFAVQLNAKRGQPGPVKYSLTRKHILTMFSNNIFVDCRSSICLMMFEKAEQDRIDSDLPRHASVSSPWQKRRAHVRASAFGDPVRLTCKSISGVLVPCLVGPLVKSKTPEQKA